MRTAFLIILLGPLLPSPASGFDRAAGSVVRSKEWKVRRAPKREEEFIGDVRYFGGPTKLASDWALFQEESRQWQARGRISVSHSLASGETFNALGERAAYNETSQKGWLEPKGGESLEFKRQAPPAPPEFGRAQRLEWEGQKTVRATGRVHCWGPQGEGWAQKASWSDGLIEMTGGRPVLHQKQGEDWTGAVKADRIDISREKGTLAADGGAVGWIQFKETSLEPSR